MTKKLHLTFLVAFFFFFTNAQDNWEVLNPKPSFLTGIDIHFVTETNGFYITSNELFYTTDSGENWELKSELSGASDIAFYESLGIIVGYSGSFLSTNDSGTTWSVKNVGVAESLNAVTILDAENIIISGNNSVFVSTDGGENWIQKNIPSIRIKKTFFVNVLIGHAVSENGEIFKTVDGGDNWYLTADFTNLAPNSFFTIYFKNEDVGFATREHSEFYKTIDGGETWQEINAGIFNAIFEFQFINEEIGFGAGEYGVYKTINGGDTWSRIGVDKNGFFANTDMNGIYFFDENKGFSVGQRGRIAKTEDSGDNWELYSPIENTVKQIEFLLNRNGIVTVGSDFFESSDNGNNWDYLGTPNIGSYTEDFDFINDNVGFCIAGGSVGTSSRAGETYKTIDGGKTWIKPENFGLSNDSAGLYCIEFVNENLGFVSGGFNSKRTYKTTDGGEIWRVVLQQAMGQIQFLNENIGYARRVGFSTDILYKTIDGGENWSEVISMEQDIGSFYFLDAQNGFVVGDDGLGLKTQNGGSSWQQLSLPYLDFEFVEFHNSNVGYIADDYGAIYKTENGGLTWDRIYNLYGLSDITINNQQEIFITGSLGKILKSQITFENASLTVGDAFNVKATSANIESIFAANGGNITNLRLEYGENGAFDESVSFNETIEAGNNQSFSSFLTGLRANTEYSYRAVATFNDVEYFSDIKTFRTLENYIFIMNQVFNPSAESAEVSARVISNNATVSDIRFEYGTNQEALTESIVASPSMVSLSDGLVNVQGLLTELNSETDYFIRARALYDGEKIYTNTISFTTRPDFSLSYYDPIISGTEVTLRANINAYKDDLTEIFFEYGIESFANQQEGSPNSVEMSRNGLVTAVLNNLSSEGIYYYRIKAKLGEDIVYGPEAIFSLSENTVLLNDEVEELKRESTVIRGRVFTNTNYLSNIQIEYGINGLFDKVIFSQPNFSSAGRTTFIEGLLTGLSPETEYDYRIKATDSNGVDHYSEEASFTTLEQLPLNNFSIITTGETCPNNENGTLQVEAVVASDYYLYLGEDLHTFNNSLLLEGLAPGTYSISIAEIGSNTVYLYEFTIQQSEGLEAKTTSTIDGFGKKINVTIDKGSLPFTVSINNKEFKHFNSNNFSFNVDFGDEVMISSKYECEGIYSLTVDPGFKKDSYENPAKSSVLFSVPENNAKVNVQLYDIQGRLLEVFQVMAENNSISLHIGNYPNGLYFVRLSGLFERTHKILKR